MVGGMNREVGAWWEELSGRGLMRGMNGEGGTRWEQCDGRGILVVHVLCSLNNHIQNQHVPCLLESTHPQQLTESNTT